MNEEFVTVRNLLNGGIARVRPRIANHPVFGKNLKIVPPGSRPFVPLSELVADTRSQDLLAPTVDEVELENNDLEEEEV